MSSRASESTIRRLSHYLRALEEMEAAGACTVSSEELARSGATSAAQVRKDLSQFGSFGKRGLGYPVAELAERIKWILGLGRPWNVVLVGAGRVGSALFAYPHFLDRGYHCVAAVDSDPAKVGTRCGPVTIRPAAELEGAIRESEAELVIIAVPAPSAQTVADRVVAAGARGILNFAPVKLRVPPGVQVNDVDLATELEALTFAVKRVEQEG